MPSYSEHVETLPGCAARYGNRGSGTDESFYDQFEGELEGHALTPEDLKGGARGIGSYFRKLRDGRLSDKDVLNATLQNSLADAKTGQRKHPHGRTTSSVWQKPA